MEGVRRVKKVPKKLHGAMKLMEEAAEVSQVVCKMVGQVDPEAELVDLLYDEVADLQAALEFFIGRNGMDRDRLERRFDLKFEKFCKRQVR